MFPSLTAVFLYLVVASAALSAQDTRAKGRPDAPITIYELSDFQCPFCRRFAIQTLPVLHREYIETGKVRLIFWNFPLTSLHPNAVAAHEVAMCAERQGKFWPMHDILYRQQETWAPLNEPGPLLLTYADSVGADREALTACVQSGSTRAAIQREAEQAYQAIGATSTPTFLIDRRLVLPGAAGMDIWRQILDSIIQVKTNGQ